MTGKEKIAIVMPSYFEDMIGGSEYQAFLFAEAAKERGHSVHYIFTGTKPLYQNPLALTLHPIKRLKINRRFGATHFIYGIQVLRILNKIRPSVVYSRSTTSWVGFVGYYAKKNHNCRSIWHIPHVEGVVRSSLSTMWHRPFDIIEKRLLEYAIHNVTTIIAHAYSQAELLQKNYGRFSHVILKEQPEPNEEIKKSKIIKIVWVANVKAWKRPECFIQLAKELSHTNAQFVMIGKSAKGLYQKQLNADIADTPNLNYLGEQPIETVNEILAQSHIFVNTSVAEGLPNTFVQSWMREVPVVSMSWDPDGILQNKGIGYLAGSFEGLVKDVQRLINDDALRELMGKKARIYALKHHSLHKNMPKLIKLIER